MRTGVLGGWAVALIDSEAVEAYLMLSQEDCEKAAGGDDIVDFLGCDIEMDELCRTAIRLDIDSCEFVVNVMEDGLPAHCRRPIRKVASDIERAVDARCR